MLRDSDHLFHFSHCRGAVQGGYINLARDRDRLQAKAPGVCWYDKITPGVLWANVDGRSRAIDCYQITAEEKVITDKART
jgi:hypothetical protein